MRRLFLAVTLAVLGLSAWFVAHSPAFNGSLPSTTLLQSLAPDYLAMDRYYAGMTNPASVDAALHRLAPPRVPFDSEQWQPTISITRADDGIRLARSAQATVAALGATAELVPIRTELERSYQEVEQAWQYERQVEQTFGRGATFGRVSTIDSPAVQHAANQSIQNIQQASALHDQAMVAVRALMSRGSSRQTADGANPSAGDQAALNAALDRGVAVNSSNPIGRFFSLPSTRP